MAKKIAPQSAPQTIESLRLHERDTGSVEVQTKTLTERIATLNKHFTSHAKDFSSRRGMNVMLAQRRKLLDYLRRTDVGRYEILIGHLGLRK
jgi:small subunit ribosomal protein S15